MKVGQAIKELREEIGISQQQLAEDAKITEADLSEIENGELPGDETLRMISEALKIPVSLIHTMAVEREDVPEQKQPLYDALFPAIKALILKIATHPQDNSNSEEAEEK